MAQPELVPVSTMPSIMRALPTDAMVHEFKQAPVTGLRAKSTHSPARSRKNLSTTAKPVMEPLAGIPPIKLRIKISVTPYTLALRLPRASLALVTNAYETTQSISSFSTCHGDAGHYG
jgi:hypothetical protein